MIRKHDSSLCQNYRKKKKRRTKEPESIKRVTNRNHEYKSKLKENRFLRKKKQNRNKINYLNYNDNIEEPKRKDKDYDSNNENNLVPRKILNTGKIIQYSEI